MLTTHCGTGKEPGHPSIFTMLYIVTGMSRNKIYVFVYLNLVYLHFGISLGSDFKKSYISGTDFFFVCFTLHVVSCRGMPVLCPQCVQRHVPFPASPHSPQIY